MTRPDLQALPSSARIPLSAPELSGNEWIYLKECLESGWISSVGPFVSRFERQFVDDYVGGAAYAVAVVNGTAGLHLALRAIGVAPEDEVLVPTLTFIAPVNAIRYCGAHPVFIDADPQTWQMDVSQVARFLSERCDVRPDVQGPGAGGSTQTCWNTRTGRRVRAILPVHLLGLACDMARIRALGEQYQLKVIEDAAEAIGVRYDGRPAGTWGDIGVFSFNGNKTLTCGGGGMVVTREHRWATRMRYLSTQAREDGREYVHRDIGHNYRMTNVHAALGVAQLEQQEKFLGRKRTIAAAYAQALRGIEGITPMPLPPRTEPAYWLYTMLLKPGTTVAQRNAMLDRLAAAGIEARPLWQPIHQQLPYQDPSYTPFEIAAAPDLYARAVSLPSSVGLSREDQDRVIAAVIEGLAG